MRKEKRKTKMNNPDTENEIPLGFSMALAKNNAAMSYFSTLTPAHRREVIAHTHTIRSKEEMEKFVSELDKTMWI
ncbi:MAG: YdeI/OmpD-associated family protein [Eubacterium sp.]|nr:YdeI/OmpD-associated family protein [Eubacterium sp.]